MTDTQHRGAAWPTVTGTLPPFADDPRRACANKDTNFWFPETGGNAVLRPIAVCRTCPLIKACAAWATPQPQLWGIWGGLTEDDRIRVRNGKPPAKRTIPTVFRDAPSSPRPSAEKARTAVAFLHDKGYSIDEIAAKIRFSRRTVQRHLRTLGRTGAERWAA